MNKDTLGSTEKGGRNNITVCHSFRSEDTKYAHKFFMTAIIFLLNIMAYMRATQSERERERGRKRKQANKVGKMPLIIILQSKAYSYAYARAQFHAK